MPVAVGKALVSHTPRLAQEEELRRKIAENAQLHQALKECEGKHRQDVDNLRRQLNESEVRAPRWSGGVRGLNVFACAARTPSLHQSSPLRVSRRVHLLRRRPKASSANSSGASTAPRSRCSRSPTSATVPQRCVAGDAPCWRDAPLRPNRGSQPRGLTLPGGAQAEPAPQHGGGPQGQGQLGGRRHRASPAGRARTASRLSASKGKALSARVPLCPP